MNTENHDEERLFGGFALLEPSAADAAEAVRMTRAAILAFERSSEPVGTAIKQDHLRHWSRFAMAASVLVVAGIVWMSFPQNDRLFAQMIQKLASARSVRVVSEKHEPGSDWQVETVTRFARDLGFSEQYFVDGEVIQTDIDDGTHHWLVRPEQKIVTQTESVEFTRHLDDLLNPLKTQYKFVRHAEGDQVIDGFNHSCYQSEAENHRVAIWLERDGRARRAFVEENSDGHWHPARRIEIAYDEEMEASTFQPPAGDGVKIVEVNQLLDELFPLESAIHREQKCGYELAVHDVKRINDVEYYLLTSFRPTKETLAKLNLQRGESPGDLLPSARYEMGERGGGMEWEAARRLAVAYGSGIRIQALLCSFRGIENERVKRARPEFTLFAHAEIWKEVKPISAVSLDFALPNEETPLRDVIRSVYDKIALLEPVTMEQLNLVDEQDGREFIDRQFVVGGYSETTRQGPRPSEIRFDDFIRHIQTADYRPDLPARAAAIAKRKRDGSDDPLTFIKELNVRVAQRPERWQQKLRTFIDTSYPEGQLAALEFIENEPMLFYAGRIVGRIEDSAEPRIRAAGQRVIELLRRPLEEFKPNASSPPIHVDVERIKSLIANLKEQVDVERTVEELRERSGLDYGDGMSTASRSRWSRWWSDEQESIATAHLGDREFIVYGRVVDRNGKPLPKRWASVMVSRELLNTGRLLSAHTRSDDNGRYVLRFGFRKLDPPGLPPVLPIVDASLSVNLLDVPAGARSQRLVLSRYNLAGDRFLNDQQDKTAVYSRQPFEKDFIDAPIGARPVR